MRSLVLQVLLYSDGSSSSKVFIETGSQFNLGYFTDRYMNRKCLSGHILEKIPASSEIIENTDCPLPGNPGPSNSS